MATASSTSMHAKILVLVVSLVSLTMMAFGYIPIYQSGKDRRAGKESFLKASSESLIDKIDRNLFERYGDVQAFSLSEPARSGDPKRIVALMNDMMSAYAPIYRMMMVLNLQGKVIAVNTVKGDGKALDASGMLGRDFSSEPWFKASVAGKVKPGTAFVDDAYQDDGLAALSGAKGRFMNFTSPIRDESGKVLGVWTNRMDFEDVVHQIILDDTAKLKTESIPNVFAYLIRKDGTYLDHPDGSNFNFKAILPGFSSIDREKLNKSFIREVDQKVGPFSGRVVEVISPSQGYSSYPAMGWSVVVQLPEAESYASLLALLSWAALGIFATAALGTFWVMRPFSATLNRVISRLGSASDEIAHSGVQMSQSSQQLSSGATQAAAALEETVASIEELSSMVKLNADHSKQAAELSQSSRVSAEQGEVEVRKLTEAMSEIEKSSKKIAEITEVIDDIAFQTNLLALNAAVEAARAGEQGRGFAVVAEAVRSLAQRSASAAKDIGDLIKQSADKTHRGTETAAKCGEVLLGIVASIKKVSSLNHEIASASSEQASGIEQIGKAMNDLDSTTQGNASASEEVAESSRLMSEQMVSIRSLVQDIRTVVQGSQSSSRSPALGMESETERTIQVAKKPHFKAA